MSSPDRRRPSGFQSTGVTEQQIIGDSFFPDTSPLIPQFQNDAPPEMSSPDKPTLSSRAGLRQDSKGETQNNDGPHTDASLSLASLAIETGASARKNNNPKSPSSSPPHAGPDGSSTLPVPSSKDKSASPCTSSNSSTSPKHNEQSLKEPADFDLGNQSDGNAAPSSTEINTIMRQFEGTNVPDEEEIMSPRMELATSIGNTLIRRSSLDRQNSKGKETSPTVDDNKSTSLSSPPKRTSSLPSADMQSECGGLTQPSRESDISPPLPQPSPTPTVPFNFNRFLEQLRHRSADPVAKYLRSFLQEFGKKQWMVHEQVKIVSDFLEFIAKKMEQCEVWRRVSDAEFDNAREGMEKLVMNRLHDQTFSPRIPSLEAISGGKRFGSLPRFFRRGQHQEDVERDGVLAQKVLIYNWVREPHLDIPSMESTSDRFLFKQAQEELNKINNYRAPRDKVICILNCCKVIFGLLRKSRSDQSADSFVPILIYVILQANPDHLVSNVQYILRFRNQDKLAGEAGYYISTLMGAIQFIESLDRTHLTITDEEFEKNVEAAVSAIAERHKEADAADRDRERQEGMTAGKWREEGQQQPQSLASSLPDEIPAVAAGIFRTIQRPLTTIGKIFSDDTHSEPSHSVGTLTPSKSGDGPDAGRSSPLLGWSDKEGERSEKGGNDDGLAVPSSQSRGTKSGPGSRSASAATTPVSSAFGLAHSPGGERRKGDGGSGATAAAGRLTAEQKAQQLSAEEAEARVIQAREHAVVADTLASMFPNLDREVIEDVVRVKNGQVSAAVDACLALSND